MNVLLQMIWRALLSLLMRLTGQLTIDHIWDESNWSGFTEPDTWISVNDLYVTPPAFHFFNHDLTLLQAFYYALFRHICCFWVWQKYATGDAAGTALSTKKRLKLAFDIGHLQGFIRQLYFRLYPLGVSRGSSFGVRLSSHWASQKNFLSQRCVFNSATAQKGTEMYSVHPEAITQNWSVTKVALCGTTAGLLSSLTIWRKEYFCSAH